MNTPIAALIASDRTHDLAQVGPAARSCQAEAGNAAAPRTRVRGRTAAALRYVAARIEPACG